MQRYVRSMAPKGAGGGEPLQLRMPAPAAGQSSGKGAKPEKQLNVFVRAVALIERVGNALGTLAFTWATVVLLGGYPTVLRQDDDFWFATTIVFLEAVRMFMSRNNRLDYQLFFRTKGAVRPLGWNGLIVIVYLSSILMYFGLIQFGMGLRLPMAMAIILLIIPAVLGLFNSSGALNLLPRPVRHTISLCSPLMATILPVPYFVTITRYYQQNIRTMATWTIFFVLLFSVVLLVTISRLRFQRVIKLVEHAVGTNTTKQVFWRQLVLNICMFVELVMLVLMPGSPGTKAGVLIYSLYSLVLVSFRNLQIPAALVRVALSLLRLIPHDYYDGPKDDAKTNLAPSLTVFYVMVLGQGIFYIVACFLEIFSFIPRRTLARRGGFRGQWGVQTVNLYYAYALEKCMEKDVLAPKKISLTSFAIGSINSSSPKKQLRGVQMMHSLLQTEPARTRLLSKLVASTKTMSRIIEMLDWISPEYGVIRMFAAKVIAELAKSVRVATVPRMMQNVSSLLDVDRILERGHTLLDTDDDEEQKQQDMLVTDVRYNQEERHVLAMDPDGNHNRRERLNPLWETSSSLETEAHATNQVGMDKHNSCLLGFLNWMSTLGSTSHEETETPTHQDYLPALGLSILDNLCCDQEIYVEITRQADLIPKIIEFTSYKNYPKNINGEQRKTLMRSSLKLLKRLSKTDGEIGMILRHKISEHPLLLMNLVEILDDRFSCQRVRKLVIGILRNLALDADISLEIGRIHVITGRLMDFFLKQAAPSSKSSNRCLQKVAGQALAMLTMESADNCKALRMEAGNVIGDLATMMSENNKKYVAARLLLNLLHHIQPDLSNLDLMKLCEILPKVLDTALDAETEMSELEVMIGLSSQMCKVVPEYFVRELENGQRKEMFVKRLVDVLKANMKPSIHCPGIRRVIIEQAIYLMTCCSSCYANIFNQYFMMEALLMVERTPSRVERYKMFLGNTGIMEHKQSLTDLVAAAKELLCHQQVRVIGNVN